MNLCSVILATLVAAAAGTSALTNAWARTVEESSAAPKAPAAVSGTVSYTLGPKAMVQTLYPDVSWLPPEYGKFYPDLAATIQKSTLQSLLRDGVKDARVEVTFPQVGGQAMVQVNIRPVNGTTRRYAKLHPTFLDANHGQAALRAVQACKAAGNPKCWDPQPVPGKPWAFHLPLGMAMATQKSLMFMDHPSSTALESQDHLKNSAVCRWSRVMGAAGGTNLAAYETIVDARPIATGSGQDATLPDPGPWFNGAKGDTYLGPMLQLLSQPAAGGASTLRPVAVFGGTPRKAWAEIIGSPPLQVLEVGDTAIGNSARKTPWIVANHPGVTTDQCCPGDPSAKCKGSQDLLRSGQTDFVAACWILTMTSASRPTADVAKESCLSAWATKPKPAAKQTMCIQAKLDNQNPAARCTSYEQAANYCSAHQANACATLDCKFDPAQVKKALPVVAKRPVGWADTCNP